MIGHKVVTEVAVLLVPARLMRMVLAWVGVVGLVEVVRVVVAAADLHAYAWVADRLCLCLYQPRLLLVLVVVLGTWSAVAGVQPLAVG